MKRQRVFGLIMIVVSIIIIILALNGCGDKDCVDPSCHDASAIFITLPLGLFSLLSKKQILY